MRKETIETVTGSQFPLLRVTLMSCYIFGTRASILLAIGAWLSSDPMNVKKSYESLTTS